MNWDAFYPPLAGSFLGVIGAFIANYALQSHFAGEYKIKFLNMIRSEFELFLTTLELDHVELLPRDRWASAINSGALKLFTETELQSLSTIYQRIKDYNHIATAEHFYPYTWDRLEREDGNRLPLDIVRPFRARRTRLIDELRELIHVEWLNPSNEAAPDDAAPGYNDSRYDEIEDP